MMYEQQAANLAFVIWIISAAAAFVVAYFVIRLAVRHAIRDARRDSEARPE